MAYRLGTDRIQNKPGYSRLTAPLQPLLGTRVDPRLNSPVNNGFSRRLPLNSQLPIAPTTPMASRLGQQDQGVRPGAYPHMNPVLPDAAANKIALTNTGFTPPNLNYQNAPGSPINQQRTMASMLANGRMLNPQVQSYLDGLEGTPQQRTQGRYSQMLENRVGQLVGPTYAGRQDRLNGLAARLGQPRQTLDGAAALQGRLTATGGQYPTTLDQGPKQRAFQPQAGTYGNSTVTVSPDGKAVVQGNYSPRRLNALGVDTYRPYEEVGTPIGTLGGIAGTFGISTGDTQPPERSYARMLGRQTANTRRMENMRLSKRLGQTDFVPDDPIRPEDAMGMDDIQSALGVQGNIARQLGAQQIAQQRPMGRFAQQLGQPAQQPQTVASRPASGDNSGRRQQLLESMTGTFRDQIASGEMNMDDLNRMADSILGTSNTAQTDQPVFRSRTEDGRGEPQTFGLSTVERDQVRGFNSEDEIIAYARANELSEGKLQQYLRAFRASQPITIMTPMPSGGRGNMFQIPTFGTQSTRRQ